jgi:serine/threonine protein kinase
MRLGQYDLLDELGKGAMGTVYRGYSLSLCRFCAVKVMMVSNQVTEASILRFQNEAMIAARLKHPHIVPIFDSGEQDGVYYFVMEMIKGHSFAEWLDNPSEADFRKGLQALAKVARALHFAHQNGVVHRDIKPDNILIDEEGEPFITDFGIAKDQDQDLKLTADDTALGTAYYMSPEQANGEHRSIGPLSDVYALGSTMYHFLTSRVPFPGHTFFEVLSQVIGREPASPRIIAKRETQRDIPLDLEVICLKAMEKEAPRRYASAEAMALDLEAFLDDRPISARPLSQMEKWQKTLRRNRVALVGLATVIGILLVMAVAFGSVTIVNMQRTIQSLRELDRSAALDNAATLERAIRNNMLQGRADIVRGLISELRNDPKLRNIDVVRTNRTYAYTDLSTRKSVEKRLQQAKIIAWIKKRYTSIVPKLTELQKQAFPNIDKTRPNEAKQTKKKRTKPKLYFPASFPAWKRMLKHVRPEMFPGTFRKEPVLTVLWPIKNGGTCQACHGDKDQKDMYGTPSNKIRAVLVVRRSQKGLQAQIRANQMATLGIGGATTIIFLFLAFLFARLFNIGPKPVEFGVSPVERKNQPT